MSLRDALVTPPSELAVHATRPVRVAVLDSGIDATHPKLVEFVDEAWAVERDERGTYVVVPRPTPQAHDDFGHGTGVASIIVRTAPCARLSDYRVLGKESAGTGAALVKSFEHAIETRHPVINMSLAAKAEFALELARLCDEAYRSGLVVIAAKRNMPLVDQGFPAELTSVVGVDRANTASTGALAYRAGEKIEWAAHGTDIVVAAPGGKFTKSTGTSFATPAVTGIVAALLSAFPDLRPFEVKSYLRAHVGV